MCYCTVKLTLRSGSPGQFLGVGRTRKHIINLVQPNIVPHQKGPIHYTQYTASWMKFCGCCPQSAVISGWELLVPLRNTVFVHRMNVLLYDVTNMSSTVLYTIYMIVKLDSKS